MEGRGGCQVVGVLDIYSNKSCLNLTKVNSFLKSHSHPTNGSYRGHQCSWNLTPTSSM